MTPVKEKSVNYNGEISDRIDRQKVNNSMSDRIDRQKVKTGDDYIIW